MKDGNARFTTVSLKALSDRSNINLLSLKTVFQMLFLLRKTKEIARIKHFPSQKNRVLSFVHGGSLKSNANSPFNQPFYLNLVRFQDHIQG